MNAPQPKPSTSEPPEAAKPTNSSPSQIVDQQRLQEAEQFRQTRVKWRDELEQQLDDPKYQSVIGRIRHRDTINTTNQDITNATTTINDYDREIGTLRATIAHRQNEFGGIDVTQQRLNSAQQRLDRHHQNTGPALAGDRAARIERMQTHGIGDHITNRIGQPPQHEGLQKRWTNAAIEIDRHISGQPRHQREQTRDIDALTRGYQSAARLHQTNQRNRQYGHNRDHGIER